MSRFQKNDNFIDKTFTIMAEILLKVFPASEEEKEAFILYRNGLGAQTEGEYAEALDKYYDALDIEECSIDRGIIFYNIGLIYSKIGNYFKALECYHFALELNDRLTQIFNNTAVLYHTQGTKASKKKCLDLSRTLFYKASIYWKGALQIEPNYYIEAQNWLIVTNRLKNI